MSLVAQQSGSPHGSYLFVRLVSASAPLIRNNYGRTEPCSVQIPYPTSPCPRSSLLGILFFNSRSSEVQTFWIYRCHYEFQPNFLFSLLRSCVWAPFRGALLDAHDHLDPTFRMPSSLFSVSSFLRINFVRLRAQLSWIRIVSLFVFRQTEHLGLQHVCPPNRLER